MSNICYNDLPQKEVWDKLVQVSFDTPQKNLSVFKFVSSIGVHYAYIENERIKLFQRYGTADKNCANIYRIERNTQNEKDFMREYQAIMSLPIEEDLPSLSITEDDFSDTKCRYPAGKEAWLNAIDIGSILGFIAKMNGDA